MDAIPQKSPKSTTPNHRATCAALTARGTRCRRPPSPGHALCVLHDPERKPRRVWTPAKLWRLMELLERGWEDARIAAALGVTANAVNLARKRHGIPARSTQLLTARSAADLLGLGCSKTVSTWVRRGWLRGTRGPRQGPHRQWLIRREDLHAYLEQPDHWHRWEPDRITDPALRQWAGEVRAGVRFLTLGQAAWRMCVQPGTVGAWIDKGLIPAVRTGDGKGNHLIRASDLDAFELPRIGGGRRNAA